MHPPLVGGRLAIGDIEALAADVVANELLRLRDIHRFHQPDVERRDRGGRNDVARLRADAAAGHAADVERRPRQQVVERLRRFIGGAEPEIAHQLRVDRGGRVDRALLERRQWHHLVVEAGNPDMSLVVFHRREQPRKLERRVRRPVAVMSAVELGPRAVDRHRERGDAACAEDDRLLACLVHGTIADQPEVRGKEILVGRDRLLQVRRPHFLFALECKSHVRLHPQSCRANGVERGQDRDDGRLVIASAARVQARFRVEG